MTTTLAPRIETAERRRRILVAVWKAAQEQRRCTIRQLLVAGDYSETSSGATLLTVQGLVVAGWLRQDGIAHSRRHIYAPGPLFGGLLRNKETGIETPLRLIE